MSVALCCITEGSKQLTAAISSLYCRWHCLLRQVSLLLSLRPLDSSICKTVAMLELKCVAIKMRKKIFLQSSSCLNMSGKSQCNRDPDN